MVDAFRLARAAATLRIVSRRAARMRLRSRQGLPFIPFGLALDRRIDGLDDGRGGDLARVGMPLAPMPC